MINFCHATWKGGTPEARHYVIDIRRAELNLKIVAEVPTEGIARLLCALLNKNENWET